MHIAIIGGGITGLSAAWEAQQRGISYSLLEASNRWGGKVISSEMRSNGARFLVEGGPDTIVTRKTEAWDLTHELGILDQLDDPGSETRGIYVLDHGSLQPIPLSPFKFIRSRLMSTRGKLRMMAEPFQPARRDDGDEALGDFVRRRLGEEALDKFIGPVLGGIYNTDPNIQSIMVSSPVMREMEKEAGSLFRAALQRGHRAHKQLAQGARKPRFITFKNGIQGIVDSLVVRLTGDLRLNARIRFIDRYRDGYQVWTSNGETLYADAVIFATLANVTSELIKNISMESSQMLGRIRHNHIGTVSLVYRESDLPKREINGLMIPRREGRAIDAVTFTSNKMPRRAAPGYALLRVFIGGGRPEVVEYEEEPLMATVKQELASLLGVTAEPVAYEIFRWQNGFPQAEVGHLELIDEIESFLPANIALAGSSYRGIAVPDCIRQGRAAVQKIIKHEGHNGHEGESGEGLLVAHGNQP